MQIELFVIDSLTAYIAFEPVLPIVPDGRYPYKNVNPLIRLLTTLVLNPACFLPTFRNKEKKKNMAAVPVIVMATDWQLISHPIQF